MIIVPLSRTDSVAPDKSELIWSENFTCRFSLKVIDVHLSAGSVALVAVFIIVRADQELHCPHTCISENIFLARRVIIGIHVNETAATAS